MFFQMAKTTRLAEGSYNRIVYTRLAQLEIHIAYIPQKVMWMQQAIVVAKAWNSRLLPTATIITRLDHIYKFGDQTIHVSAQVEDALDGIRFTTDQIRINAIP